MLRPLRPTCAHFAALAALVACALAVPSCASHVEVPLDAMYFQRYCAAACSDPSRVQHCADNLAAARDTAMEVGCGPEMQALWDCVLQDPGAGWCRWYWDSSPCAEVGAFESCVEGNYAPSVCGRAFAFENACGARIAEPGDVPCLYNARCMARCALAASCPDVVAIDGIGSPCPDPMNAYLTCDLGCGQGLD
jgi:hypothetical protein